MEITDLADHLLKYGLTNSEALMYCFLLQSKSATVSEIQKSDIFKNTRRPNLYKILHGLEDKKFISSEVKGRKTRFFAIEPTNALSLFIQDQEQKLRGLKENSEHLVPKLNALVDQPNPSFSIIPEELKIFHHTLIEDNWLIREMPEIIERRGMGKMFSVEYDTRHKFSANSAGIAVTKFMFPEHRDQKFNRILTEFKHNMEEALQNFEEHGPFKLKEYWFEEKYLKTSEYGQKIPYIQSNIKANIPGKFQGGLGVYKLEGYETYAVGIWSAKLSDFKLMMEKLVKNFVLQL